MKLPFKLIITLALFSTLGITLYLINQSEQDSRPESWSAFIYSGDYASGRYQKQDGFLDYPTCRAFATASANNPNNATWECGLNCEFDSRRQGFQCLTMEND